MGRIHEVSPRVSVETRRESAAFVVDDAHATQDDGCARMEFHYRDVFAVAAACNEIVQSERFRDWLRRREDTSHD